MSSSTSRGRGRPAAGNPDATSRRIVQAAREVFSERGYDGATFQMIAERADLTRPALNHYFPAKRVLYWAVVDQTYQLLVVAGTKRGRRESTAMGRVTAFIANGAHANSTHPCTSKFMVTSVLESRRHPELIRPLDISRPTSRDFLAWVVHEAVENGELAAQVDPAKLLEALLVVLAGAGLYSGYLRADSKPEAVTEMVRRLLEGDLWPKVKP